MLTWLCCFLQLIHATIIILTSFCCGIGAAQPSLLAVTDAPSHNRCLPS